MKRLQFFKLPALLSNLFVLFKTLPFFLGLIVSYTFMENSVTSMLMDYLTSPGRENLPVAAIITNLQDGLSCISAAIVSVVSEAYTGRFTMITFCSSASIMGLMLLWISASSSSDYVMAYAAISLITLGSVGGSTLLQEFFYYQLDEKVRAKMEKTPQHENADNERKEDRNSGKTEKQVHVVAIILWQLAVWCFGYATTVFFTVFADVPDLLLYWKYFRFAALLMVGAHLFFYFGYAWYSHEKLPAESNLGKIYRICKAAYGKRKFKYPTSENGYYWKNYKQRNFYKTKKGQQRLLPRVPSLFRWLDKAAIVKGQETEGELCMVKEVREVKSLALLICWSFTFFAYSLVVASGNTFFVEQTSNLDSAYTGNDIPLLFVVKSVMRDIVLFFCWLISIAFKIMEKVKLTKKFKRINATIIRIGIGMVCAVFCCVKARDVELRRLRLINELVNGKDLDASIPISMSTKALVPQFSLLGITEGLAEDGLNKLFHGYASQSMRTFDEPFSQLVIGIGKLLTIPCVLIFRSWFKEKANASHLDRYYLMLAILNSMFLLFFTFYYFRYAYKNEYPKDEEIVMEQRLEHGHQAGSGEANAREENLAIREGLEVSERNEEIVIEQRLKHAHQADSEESNKREEIWLLGEGQWSHPKRIPTRKIMMK